jgi:hypothetical protein
VNTYNFPLELRIDLEDNTSIVDTVRVTKRESQFEIKCNKKPVNVLADPNNRLLGIFLSRNN